MMMIIIIIKKKKNEIVPSGKIVGMKSSVVSGVNLDKSHTAIPSAAPAAMAAPRAVVSVILGRTVHNIKGKFSHL